MISTRTSKNGEPPIHVSGYETVLHNAYFKCTRCDKVKPASHFGLRRVGKDGTVRNQAQCTDCRAK